MARYKKEELRSVPQLFLITPANAGADFAPKLKAVLQTGAVASVLIWGEATEGAAYQERAASLTPIIQDAGAAALVRGDVTFAKTAEADGFHADADQAALEKALGALKPDYIVGAAHLRSTHEAMAAGEAGPDYVFFGNLHAPHDPANDIDLLTERAAWWQSLVVVPCVFFANELAHALPLAEAGADFVALHDAFWAHGNPAGLAETLQSEFSKINLAVA